MTSFWWGDGLGGEILPEPTFDERIAVMNKHLDLMVKVFGEKHGCLKFRKVALQYTKRFGPAKEFDRRVVWLSSRAGFYEIVQAYCEWRQKFLDENQRLRPQYEPRPLGATFLEEETAGAVPVPKGPNELW